MGRLFHNPNCGKLEPARAFLAKMRGPHATSESTGRNPGGYDAVLHADAAGRDTHDPKGQQLIEAAVERENMLAAWRRVRANKGAPGVDDMTVDALWPWLQANWPRIKAQLLKGTYQPAPVRKVEIPKPGGKGKRQLGIPTVLDRLIQQALHQVLQPVFDDDFSENSYGFRPNRSAHDAVKQARRYVSDGKRWVVDMDLEKFFDRVNHDILMSRVARKVEDKRVLRLIRRYLQAGVMDGGVVSPRTEGTPQGGPLSPLLSNILLDDLDKELERRGHAFCRYAADCNIYLRTRRSGERMLDSVTRNFAGGSTTSASVKSKAFSRRWTSGFAGDCGTSSGGSGSDHGRGGSD